MQVKQLENGRFEYKRDSWKEWFTFSVSKKYFDMIADMKIQVPMPKGYSLSFPYRKESWTTFYTETLFYRRTFTIPFFWMYSFILYWAIFAWYRPAHWFRMNGMLDKEEGAMYPKLWPLQLHLRPKGWMPPIKVSELAKLNRHQRRHLGKKFNRNIPGTAKPIIGGRY